MARGKFAYTMDVMVGLGGGGRQQQRTRVTARRQAWLTMFRAGSNGLEQNPTCRIVPE